ncbi:type II TA system antitoxin MqsA family protein [Geomonas azotofigens]|uniref:type II TA system antitoxin MqsA family protein n=1 Tax=Geomonas azotofigens TaxID=2843196 RepID=UPI001C1221F6|nr:type II TA system antitoxin MqsA family protein [Geomonas azotofigens]MBU5612144.1 type II toxin-antitoxin system MqsA family antitoxin [Geomonas azotofigens]
MKCPACGNEMVTEVREETLSYRGESMTLSGMQGQFCTACGEGVWDDQSYRRYTDAQETMLRTVKEEVSSYIRRIRKELKLTQSELAEAFGVGKVAFSRYERGETRPPAPVVKLLKLIEKHPELLKEMQEVPLQGRFARDLLPRPNAGKQSPSRDPERPA